MRHWGSREVQRIKNLLFNKRKKGDSNLKKKTQQELKKLSSEVIVDGEGKTGDGHRSSKGGKEKRQQGEVCYSVCIYMVTDWGVLIVVLDTVWDPPTLLVSCLCLFCLSFSQQLAQFLVDRLTETSKRVHL